MKELGPFCWPVLAEDVAGFQGFSLICWIYFSDVMVCWDSESCSGSDWQQTTKQWSWPFLGASLALGSVLEFLLSPSIELVVTSCRIKSTSYCTSQSDQEVDQLLLHRIRGDPSKWRTSPVAQTVKCLPTMWETQVQCLSWEDPLEKEMAPHSSTLALKIPWMEEPGRLQFMGLQRVRHDWVTKLSLSLQNDDFFNFGSAHEAPTYQAFYLSSLLQMPNDHRMVNLEFFGNFSG